MRPNTGRTAEFATSSEYDDIAYIRELALDAVPQGIVIGDALDEFNIIYVNPAFCSMTGYAKDEVIGRNCRFLSGADTDEKVRAEIRECLAANRPFHGTILNYRKDGTPFWNELTINPLSDGDRRFAVGVQVDVTEKRALEKVLRETQKMEALGKLSGGIAHDFNNLLALIMGNAELVAEDADTNPRVREAATDIVDAAAVGSRLVRKMLDFAGGETSRSEEVDANAVVDHTIAILSRTLGQPYTLHRELASGPTAIVVDRTLLETALINLVINARDAMPEGGTITIQTARQSNVSPELIAAICISVTDNGIGMTDAVKARAFEPFFTTKQSDRGSGLGLSMVQGFVAQSGGEIRIKSKQGVGTTISMMFPEQEAGLSDANASPLAGVTKVLLVEDDPQLRKVLARHLRGAGHHVDDAATATEALSMIAANDRYDHVVSDIRLPGGLSGVDLVRHLRDRGMPTNIVLMTGYTTELESFDPDEHGIKLLQKPFPVRALLDAVGLPDAGSGFAGDAG